MPSRSSCLSLHPSCAETVQVNPTLTHFCVICYLPLFGYPPVWCGRLVELGKLFEFLMDIVGSLQRSNSEQREKMARDLET